MKKVRKRQKRDRNKKNGKKRFYIYAQNDT